MVQLFITKQNATVLFLLTLIFFEWIDEISAPALLLTGFGINRL